MPGNPSHEPGIWRTAGGDATRRGLFPKKVLIHARPERRLPAHGAVQASVVFDDTPRVFVADLSGVLQAFSLKGDPLWRVKLPAGISATPAVHPSSGLIFVGTHGGWVYALETAQGRVAWSKAIPTKSDPRILSDFLYLPQTDALVLSSWGGRFYALAAESGEERFSWDAGISPYASAAADANGNLYCLRAVGGQGVELVRIRAKGEEQLLRRASEEKRGARRALVAAAPMVDGERDRVYFVVNHDHGSALHAWSMTSDSLLWSLPLPHCVQATPALRTDGTVLLADLAGEVQAAGPDGNLRFRCACGCDYLLAGGITEANGTFYLGDPLGVVHCVDDQGRGKPLFEAPRAIQARPSFAPDGRLFVPCTDHAVCVFPNQAHARWS